MVREAIKRAMKAKNVTGYQLAKASGVPKAVVYRFLNGTPKGPTERVELAHVDAMLEALGLTVSPRRKRKT
jgi:transcriptional regulator with XRE-family HTH domain